MISKYLCILFSIFIVDSIVIDGLIGLQIY